MKKLGFIAFLSFVLFFSCDNGLSSNNSHNSGASLSNIRSAVYDPVTGCTIEQVHQHNGIYYGGHFNNDGHGHHGLYADTICILDSCSVTNLHQHNGRYYAGHHGSDSCVGHGHGNGHHG